MSSIYDGIESVTVKEICDKPGFIRKALSNIEEMTYDKRTSLVCLLKLELEDQEEAFEIFEEFYDKLEKDDTKTATEKYDEAGLEAGDITIGSLVHWLQEDDVYNRDDYTEFYGNKPATAKDIVKRKEIKYRKPEGFAPLPVPIPEELPWGEFSRCFDEGDTYATATDLTKQKYLSIRDPYQEDMQQYISVNPMRSDLGNIRNQNNVTKFNYCVIEFDDVEGLDVQRGIIEAFKLPIEAMVDTGGKSLHCWIRLDAATIEEYKERTKLLGSMMNKLGYYPDGKVLKDCSSWVRMPGIVRDDSWNPNVVAGKKPDKSGNMQKLVWCGPAQTTWSKWMDEIYPQFLENYVEESEEEIETFPEELQKNWKRTANMLNKIYGEDVQEGMKQNAANIPDLEPFILAVLNDVVGKFAKTNRKVEIDAHLLYSIFRDPLIESGALYDGCIRTMLYDSSKAVLVLFEERKARAKEILQESFEGSIAILSELASEELLVDMSRKIEEAESVEDEEKIKRSLTNLLEETQLSKGAILKKVTVDTMIEPLADLLLSRRDDLYVKDAKLSTYRDPSFEEITPHNFPEKISSSVVFVGYSHERKYYAYEPADPRVKKILASYSFIDRFKLVKLVSKVPVFDPNNGDPKIVTGYSKNLSTLVVGSGNGYGFLELDEAIKTLKELYVDFKFVTPSDASRAMAGMLLPALTQAGLTRDSNRPLIYVEADGPGSGKGYLVSTMTKPYADMLYTVTQKDSEKEFMEGINKGLADGLGQIFLDNLESTKYMPELKSSGLDVILSATEGAGGEVSGRLSGMKSQSLCVALVMLYAASNGITMSEDLGTRSYFVSIKKHALDFQYTQYLEGSLQKHIEKNRCKIMSSIYTILKEYVRRGCPLEQGKEGHRFNISHGVVNYILVEIMGMADCSLGQASKQELVTNADTSRLKKISQILRSTGNLGKELSYTDMFVILLDHGVKYVKVEESEIFDEDGDIFDAVVKKDIGRQMARVFKKAFGKRADSKPKAVIVEDILITRTYNKATRSAEYRFTEIESE